MHSAYTLSTRCTCIRLGLIIVGDAALENCNQSAACCDTGTRYDEPLNPRLGSGPTFNATSCDTVCSGMGMVSE